MSKPPVVPDKSTSGIAIDPRTLDRVVPESRRPDGSVRKEIRIRPGYTPQEDMTRFRGTRQIQMDRNALPSGHILGWVAPSSASKPKPVEAGGSISKSAKKNEKRKEKRDKKKDEIIRAHWEEDDVVKDADGAPNWAETAKGQESQNQVTVQDAGDKNGKGAHGEEPSASEAEDLGRQLKHLEIR